MVNCLFVKDQKSYEKSNQELSQDTILFSVDEELSEKEYKGKVKDYKFLDVYARFLDDNKASYAWNWVQKWYSKKCCDGKSMKEQLIYNNQTLCYFLTYFIASDFTGLKRFNFASHALFYIDAINLALDEYKPDEIVVENKEGLFNNMLLRIAKQRKIKVKLLNIDYPKASFKERINSNILLIRFYVKTRFFLKWLLGLFTIKTKPGKVLIMSADRFSFGNNEDNIFWGSVAKEMNERKIDYSVVEYDSVAELDSLRKMFKRHFLKKKDSNYIGKYYNLNTFVKIREIDKFFRRKWNLIKHKKAFMDSFEYKGIKFFDFMDDNLKLVFNVISLQVGEVLALTQAMFEEEKPEIVLLEHEENLFGKASIINSKNINVKTIALQHELVARKKTLQRHYKSKLALNKNSPLWRPLPDLKCVTGPMVKKLLVNYGNYNPNIIKITGQPRYDTITNNKNFNKAKILKKFKIPKNKKVIVYASKFESFEFNGLREFVRLANIEKNLFVIFKFHYNADMNFYKSILPKSENVLLVKDVNLFKLLFACDIFVTVKSTVAMEAMFLNKPVIIFDKTNLSFMPYITQGAAYGVYSEKEIKPAIKKILNDQKIRENLVKNGKKFLRGYMFKLDGKATKRVVDVIKSELK